MHASWQIASSSSVVMPGRDRGAGGGEHLGGRRAGAAHALDDVGRLHVRLGPADGDAGLGVGRAARSRRAPCRVGADRARHDAALELLVAALELPAAPAPAGVVRTQRGGSSRSSTHHVQPTASRSGERGRDGGDDVVDLRQDRLLERRLVGDVGVERGHPPDRRFEVGPELLRRPTPRSRRRSPR